MVRNEPGSGRVHRRHRRPGDPPQPIGTPLLLVGGEHLFGPLMPGLARSLTDDHGWSDVRVHEVRGAAHYLVEERPEEIAELIERHTQAG